VKGRGHVTPDESRTTLIRLDEHTVVDGVRVRLATALIVVVHEDARAGVYVSHAPALDLYSQGRTEHEALCAIEHAIRSYVFTAHRRKSLGWILQHCALTSGEDPLGASSGQYVRVSSDRPLAASVDTPVAVGLAAS
jgi:hypothetical protein